MEQKFKVLKRAFQDNSPKKVPLEWDIHTSSSGLRDWCQICSGYLFVLHVVSSQQWNGFPRTLMIFDDLIHFPQNFKAWNSRTSKREKDHWISIPWEAHEMTLTCMRVIIEAAFIKLVISHWFVLQLITMGEQLINNFSCIQDWLHAEICTSAMRRGAPLPCHVCTEGNELSATGKAS